MTHRNPPAAAESEDALGRRARVESLMALLRHARSALVARQRVLEACLVRVGAPPPEPLDVQPQMAQSARRIRRHGQLL